MYTILLLGIVSFIALLISKSSDREVWVLVTILGGALFCSLLFFYIISRACSDDTLRKYEEKRDAIVYRLEHNINPIETITDAKSFNDKILLGRSAYENPWGNFICDGDAPMRIDLIDIEDIKIEIAYPRLKGDA